MARQGSGVKGRKALGRGLSALLPPATESDSGRALEVPLLSIHPNPNQPRKHFDPDKLAELAETVKGVGLLQPLLVRKVSAGYELISGERRWRAAKQLGLTKVGVVVLEADDAQSYLMSLVENLQREDLDLLEEAEAYRCLVEEFGLTQEDLATQVGKDRSTVANTLRILKLPASVKSALQQGQLTAGHARALLGLSAAQIEAVSRQVIRRGLTVRATEQLVRRLREGKPVPRAKTAEVSPAQQDLERQLCQSLGTRVRLRTKNKGRGRIEIEYYSQDELQRLLEHLMP